MVILFFVWPSASNITDVAESPSPKRIDYFGAILNAVFSICFVFVLQQVGTRKYAWGSAPAIVLLTVTGVSTVGFYVWSWYIGHGKIATWILPQLPWRLITHRPMGMAIL